MAIPFLTCGGARADPGPRPSRDRSPPVAPGHRRDSLGGDTRGARAARIRGWVMRGEPFGPLEQRRRDGGLPVVAQPQLHQPRLVGRRGAVPCAFLPAEAAGSAREVLFGRRIVELARRHGDWPPLVRPRAARGSGGTMGAEIALPLATAQPLVRAGLRAMLAAVPGVRLADAAATGVAHSVIPSRPPVIRRPPAADVHRSPARGIAPCPSARYRGDRRSPLAHASEVRS